jgi:hypothetical protein
MNINMKYIFNTPDPNSHMMYCLLPFNILIYFSQTTDPTETTLGIM